MSEMGQFGVPKKTERIFVSAIILTMTAFILFFGIKYRHEVVKEFLNINPQNSLEKVHKRNAIERKARRLAENYQFDEAIKLYRQAIQPEYITLEYEKSTGMFKLLSIYKLIHEYDKAFEIIDWYLKDNPNETEIVWKKEVEALAAYEKTKNPKVIYEYIEFLKATYRERIPPLRLDDTGLFAVVTIFKLYDVIGDYDAGIKFVDDILDWLFSQSAKQELNISRPRTSAECLAKGKWDNPTVSFRDPEWRSYKLVYQYLTVREGYEKDKRNGGPDCAGQEYCVGSATKALIKSDYFPW